MRFRAALLAAAILAAALTACGGASDDCQPTSSKVIECAPEKRPAAPPLSGELLEGGRYELSQDRGQVVVVNFWGSWCAPCRAEIDDLEQVYQATKDQGVRFLGINVRDDRDKAKAFHSGKVSYPSVLDPSSKLALDFEIPPNSIPATIVLDREGRIAVVIRTSITAAEFEPVVARLAAEAS
ncbi:TlpA disulfide reductase family protein [Phytohabitans sp. ZYX-F-186]|uniref:TlpA disulfide reductase family protein n=1 Tax=Phytohabitans maris TaxID=3071409 RepID=A0ABU0ZE22_9ACTN|nr:TlpA disulfide reductase family protein [Phytohabitans sp. ZYX-F-186]MDQ7905313.1 TlpA disulfide reductase family protein [Phytohabitans sp. ZYX-F-186]